MNTPQAEKIRALRRKLRRAKIGLGLSTSLLVVVAFGIALFIRGPSPESSPFRWIVLGQVAASLPILILPLLACIYYCVTFFGSRRRIKELTGS